jgi:hypothetical protein
MNQTVLFNNKKGARPMNKNKCPICKTSGSIELLVDTFYGDGTYVFKFDENLKAIRDTKKESKMDFCDKDREIYCAECGCTCSSGLFHMRKVIRKINPGLL